MIHSLIRKKNGRISETMNATLIIFQTSSDGKRLKKSKTPLKTTVTKLSSIQLLSNLAIQMNWISLEN